MKFFGKLAGRKYREIVISVTLFVLLDTGILGLNFYITTQLDQDAHAISMVTRQQTLAEEMLKGLYAIHADLQLTGSGYQTSIDNMASAFKQFDETLDSMVYGGKLIGEGQGGDDLFAGTAYAELNQRELADIEALWKDYRQLVMPIAHSYFNDYSRQEISERTEKTLAFAREKHGNLSKLLGTLSSNIETTTRNKVQTIRKVQAAGIVLAIANFVLILFHFIRKLNRSDEDAEKAEHEIREILGTVNEGLFLLDRQLIIGEQQSTCLLQILPSDAFAGRHFLDVMRPYVTEKTLTTANEYIQLLFSEHVEESLIQDLNPLQEVSIHIDSKDGSFTVRHLQFSFRRTWDRTQLGHVLVSVADITEAVELRKALKKSEMKAEEDMAMLTAILHLDPRTLEDFLITSRDTLEQINHIFRDPGRNARSLAEKLHRTQRLAHKLKGDCSLIDLRFLLERVHQFENRLKSLQEKSALSGDDFVGAAVELDRLMRDVGTVQTLTGRLGKFATSNTAAKNDGHANSWQQQLDDMAQRIARDENKQVRIAWQGSETEDMPKTLRAAVQDIIVQCTRNAICHGIEAPSSRVMMGKPETGTIEITLAKVALRTEPHGIRLNIRDDGAGIDLARIRARALESHIVSPDKLEKLDTAKLVTMIFHPNFSTARATGLHAGRGVGLSLVREILHANRGSVSLKHKAGSFTEFSFLLPVPVGQQTLDPAETRGNAA